MCESRSWLVQLEEDIEFLDDGFMKAVEEYQKKYNNLSTAEEALKSANWNVVEFQTLLQQAQLLKQSYEAELSNINPATFTPEVLRGIEGSLRAMGSEGKSYLRNLFKRKRCAASHVLVLMLPDERRQKKTCLASEVHSLQNFERSVCAGFYKRCQTTHDGERSGSCW